LSSGCKGKLNKAKAAFHNAIELNPDFARAHYNLGEAYLKELRYDHAIASFQTAAKLQPKNATIHCELAFALNKRDQLDEAINSLKRAIRLDPKHLSAHNNLGIYLSKRGDVAEAILEFQKVIELDAEHALAHRDLGLSLHRQGRFREAVEALRRGKKLGSVPPDWLRQEEQLAQLDERLPAVLAGNDKPRDVAEYLGFAHVCQRGHKYYAATARFYAAAFNAQPALAANPPAGHRYNAGCAAALAGCGKGNDAANLTTEEQARLRQQALEWLRADLAAYRRRLEQEPNSTSPLARLLPEDAHKDRLLVKQRLHHLLTDAELAGVRDDAALNKLPDAERPSWLQLWADVRGVLALAQDKAAPEKKPAAK
jgi:tetratricopeptide (TPR) repeat protein